MSLVSARADQVLTNDRLSHNRHCRVEILLMTGMATSCFIRDQLDDAV